MLIIESCLLKYILIRLKRVFPNDKGYSEMDSKSVQKPKIESLQALRALAFLGIFFSHTHFFIEWSALGVSIFFVLSGFIMMYRYDGIDFVPSLKTNTIFSLKKVSKLYRLHILTMLSIFALYFAVIIHKGITKKAVVELLERTTLNTVLLQTWVPNISINVSMNGVAWFLSVMLFLYYLFPWLKTRITRFKTTELYVSIIFVLLVQIVSCILVIYFFGEDSSVYKWFSYCFPVFRTGDFFAGCAVERLYFYSYKNEISNIKASFCEITATVVSVLILICRNTKDKNIVLLAICNPTTLFIPLAAIWICLFTINKGVITKLLVNKFLLYIGDLSSYVFLIHYVVVLYVSAIKFLSTDIEGIYKIILVGAELFVTIVLARIYKRVEDSGFFGILRKK